MATFGKTTNGAGSSGSSVDRTYVSSASPASSGTVSSITVRLWLASAGTGTWKGVIYSDSAGSPNTLLATSDEATFTSTSETDQTANFSGANLISITSGATYWIGAQQKDPGAMNINRSQDSTAGQTRSEADTYADGPMDPWSGTATSSGPLDCFVTYTESATNHYLGLLGIGS
jgi:hypothetical protein